MFNISEKYIAAAHSTSRETELRGRIILKNGNVVPFTSIDLLQGSTSYSNKCLSEDTFTLGSCYIGEFKTTIKTNIDRYALYGGTIIVEFLLKVDEGEWETVNIGTFTITSAKRAGQYVQIDSFDNMSLLEAEVHVGTSGTAEDLLTWICQECKIDSGMTPEMWGALTNTEFVFAFADGDFNTYRDILSDIATMVGGFATVDRFGGLIIRPFGVEPVDVVDDKIRNNSKFEDYICKYTSLSINVKGTNYFQAAETNDGMTIILHDNKIAGANSPQQIETMIFNIIEKIQGVQYVPCDITMMVNPAYELGDAINFTGYNTDNNTIQSNIHSISWTFRSSMTISGIGENSKIANAKTSTDKAISEAGNAASRVEMKTIQFTNARAVEVEGSRRATLLDASFSATYDETAVPILSGQFVAEIEEPAVYRIIYELNDEEIEFKPQEAIHTTGSKIFTFIKSLSGLSAEISNRLRIYLECDPITIKSHNLVKDETTGEYALEEIETTYNGKANIAVSNLQAILQSANLSFEIKWDGNFEIIESYDQVINILKCKPVNDYYDIAEVGLQESQKVTIFEQTVCVHSSIGVIAPPHTMEIIFDYDAIPIYNLPYVELPNGGSSSSTLNDTSVVINPYTNKAGCCASYYMQLEAGEQTRITLTTNVNAQLYLIDALTEDIYNVAITAENGIIDYTSTGARFWLLILSDSRHDNGAFTITTQKI